MGNPDSPAVEWLEEVDGEDVVIGRRPRSEIHRLGLRHRAVHILLFDPSGRVFLQKRSLHKDMNPGLWDTSAAGHVDPGETYEISALRELEEELGIRARPPLPYLFKLPAEQATGWEFVKVYRLIHPGPTRINRQEIDEGRWFERAALERWLAAGTGELTPTFEAIWRRLRNSG